MSPRAQTGWTPDDIEAVRPLLPFLKAGRLGLTRARWTPGGDVNELVAPIVLAVLVEVAKQVPLAEMTAALARRVTEQDGGIPNDAITPADMRAAHHPTDTTGETR